MSRTLPRVVSLTTRHLPKLSISSILSPPFPETLTVKSSASSLFFYDSSIDDDDTRANPANTANSKPQTTIDPRLSYTTHTISTEAFVSSLEAQHVTPSSPSHYFTAPLTSPSFIPFLRAHLPSYRSGIITAFPTEPSRLNPSIWLGGLSTTTQTHYDVYDNVLTQLCGMKRVRVFNPDSCDELGMFPDSDPR